MLFTVEDLERLMARQFDEDEADQAEMMITGAQAYLESYLDTHFSVELLAETCKADYRGEVSLGRTPVLSVTSVKDVRLNDEDPDWEWDGLDTIFNLQPHQVVLVSYSSGWEDIPADLIQVAMFMVQRLMQNPHGIRQTTTGAMSDTYVGEVGVFSLSSMEEKILNKYVATSETWRLGPTMHPSAGLPVL